MGNYTAKSTINLEVNGTQAKRMLDSLRTQADSLSKKMREAAAAGDKVKMRKLQRELNEVNSMMSKLTSETTQVTNVLMRLDKATPKELRKTLSTLQRQLQSMERGSDAWNKQIAKIKQVKAEIDKVNASLREAEGPLSKFNNWWGKTQTVIMGATAAITGLVMAGRKAVNAYAEMEQEMANVRKYTGMTEQQVASLNEAFIKMDTRSSREDLNKLAQEAGRLGKTSVEDVLGFVRAADKINVALDDLGDGATLTLSKLTGIFGDEKRLGTERSLLAVGSVINELSQNCSASAPYLAQFASRMGGVGAQAGLTVQQIMGFAAVLDSNNQALEASATALSQVMVRIYQDPAKYAKVAGMDVKKFSELVKTDMNEAFLFFMQSLQKAGRMDVLSPMFKDMGENGSRAISAMSTLAANIDQVVAQQNAANEAFREATSIDAEFNVQNNTVQAGLDKARKRVTEIAVELGEKLAPMMSHVISTSGIALRFLSTFIDFLFKNQKQIITLALAVGAYSVAVNLATFRTKALAAAHAIHAGILATEKAAYLACAAAVNLLSGNTTKATACVRLMNASFLASPIGLVVAAVTALVAGLVLLGKETESYVKKADKLASKALEVKDSTLKEQRQLAELVGVMKGAKEGTEKYEDAKKSIISQYGKYLSGLIDEKGEIINLAQAYDTLTEAVQRSARERGLNAAKDDLQDQHLKEQTTDLSRLQMSLESYGADPIEASAIATKVAMAMATDQPVDGSTLKLLEKYSLNLPTKDNTSGKEISGAVAQRAAKNGYGFVIDSSGVHSKDAASPLDIYSKMRTDSKDYQKGIERIEALELGVNPTRNYKSEDLISSLNKLNEVIESNESDAVYLPNIFVSDDAKDIPIGVLTPEAQKKWAARDVSQDGKYVKAPEDTPPSKDLSGQTKKGSFAVEPLDLTSGSRDKYSGSGFSNVAVSPAQAKELKAQIEQELRLRGVRFGGNDAGSDSSDLPSDSGSDYSRPLSDKERKKMEAEARRAAIKARKEFKAELDAIKAERDNSLASLMAERATGDIDYLQYQQGKYDTEKKFYDDSIALYEKWNLKEDDDHAALLKKREEREAEWTKEKISLNKDAIHRIAAEEERELNYEYSKDPDKALVEEIAHQEELLAIRLNALEMERDLYDKGAREYEEMQRKIDDLLFADKEAKQKMLVQRVAEFQKQFDKLTVKEQYDLNISALHSLRKEEMISEEQFQKWKKALEKQFAKDSEAEKRQLPGNSPDTAKFRASEARKNFDSQKDSLDKALADKVIDADEYAVRLQRIKNEMNEALIDPLKTAQSEWVQMLTSAYDAWANFANALKDPDADPFAAIANGITATAAIVNAVMQQITEFSNAEYEIQAKAVEKRYDREIKFAEGNAYLTKKLEKEKQDELNRLKAEQSKKDFQMQVIATIAQTAANAVQAYSAGLSIGGPAGLIMAPIAAALAVAQGAVQIALLKKQQQAAAAVGYSEGGFTRPGRKDEPAGIVHAGEWVASQKLVNNPKTRPMIEFLEHAQRSNRIGSITMEDVSRSVAAPMFNAFAPAQAQPVIVQQSAPAPASVSDPELSQSIARLNSRLERPFVTVNSVTGEGGIREAERKYDRMIRNKSRKQRS